MISCWAGLTDVEVSYRAKRLTSPFDLTQHTGSSRPGFLVLCRVRWTSPDTTSSTDGRLCDPVLLDDLQRWEIHLSLRNGLRVQRQMFSRMHNRGTNRWPLHAYTELVLAVFPPKGHRFCTLTKGPRSSSLLGRLYEHFVEKFLCRDVFVDHGKVERLLVTSWSTWDSTSNTGLMPVAIKIVL